MTDTISINRAPVLALWAAVVAERLVERRFSLRSLALAKQHDGAAGWYRDRAEWPSLSWGLVDHADYYRWNRVPAAILSHPYMAEPDVLREFAESGYADRGLGVAVLPCKSWYFPGATIPVLIARPAEIDAVLARLA